MTERHLVTRQQVVDIAIKVNSLDDAGAFRGTGYKLMKPSAYAARELLADFIVECEAGPWWHFGRFGQYVILQPGRDGIHVTHTLESYYLLDLDAAQKVQQHFTVLTETEPAFLAADMMPRIDVQMETIGVNDSGKTG